MRLLFNPVVRVADNNVWIEINEPIGEWQVVFYGKQLILGRMAAELLGVDYIQDIAMAPCDHVASAIFQGQRWAAAAEVLDVQLGVDVGVGDGQEEDAQRLLPGGVAELRGKLSRSWYPNLAFLGRGGALCGRHSRAVATLVAALFFSVLALPWVPLHRIRFGFQLHVFVNRGINVPLEEA